jgi:threonine/homoserine/homoserine lactone efflux protein
VRVTLVPAHELLAFAAAAFVLIVIPGPSVVFVIGRALAYGRSVALATVAGNSLGLFLVMVLVALGLGALVAESAAVFTVVKLAGAAYLVWLGVQAMRHRRSLHVDDPDAVRATLPWPVAVRQGFVVGVANPKAFMIFAAVLPQFVTPAAGRVPAQMLLLGLLAVLIGVVSDVVWALLASRLRSWFNDSPVRGRRLTATGGLSMIGLGLTLAATGRPE